MGIVEDRDKMWAEYSRKKTPELREKLIIEYSGLVKVVAGKLSMYLGYNVEYDDLVGYGVFGLIDAIDKFDYGKGIKFETYASLRIRGEILDQIRRMDWIPRTVRQKQKQLDAAYRTIEDRTGRLATDEEIADELGISVSELQQTVMKVSGTSVLSLNDVWYSGDDSDKVSIGDSIESPSSMNPDVIVEREEVRRVIIEAINELPEKEKMVLVLYYHEDLTFKEIGQVLNVSESRISQLHTKANLRLRAKLTNIRKGII